MPIVLFAVWLALAGEITFASVGAGLVASLITHRLFSGSMFGQTMLGSKTTLRLGGLFRRLLLLDQAIVWYIFVVLHSGARVAWYALSPGQKIRPGIIKVPTTLSTDFGVAVLANLITLTPGTFVMDYDPSEKCYFVHVLRTGPGADAEALRVISGLERWVRRVVE